MVIQDPPFAVWSDDDHSGPILIVTTICLFYWLIPGIIQQWMTHPRDARFTYSEVTFILSMVRTVYCRTLISSI